MTTPTVNMPPLPVVAYRYKNNRGSGKFAYTFYSPEEEPGAYKDNCLDIDQLCKVSDAQAHATQRTADLEAKLAIAYRNGYVQGGIDAALELQRLQDARAALASTGTLPSTVEPTAQPAPSSVEHNLWVIKEWALLHLGGMHNITIAASSARAACLAAIAAGGDRT